MENLNQMEGKLIIQDRVLGGAQSDFYDTKDTGGVIQLAKISNKNYIDNILGKKKNKITQLVAEEQRIYDMRSSYPPGKIAYDQYHALAQEIFPILDYINKTCHHNLLI